jgi:hypothetical protein
MIPIRARSGALILAASIAGCSTGDFATNPGDGPPVVTEPTCTVNGVAGPCTLPVQSDISSFDITLTSSSCNATDDHLRVTQPVVKDLTSDACHENLGKKWSVNGPFPAGSAINVQIISTQLQRPPSLKAEGQFPNWTLTFEDGGDSDINDVVLAVTAHQ